MIAFLDLLGSVAKVVGGNQPDASGRPYWYSGRDLADGSGVTGLAGCHSLPPEVLETTPVAIVLPGAWVPMTNFPTQGHKVTEDAIRVWVMVGHDDLQSQMAMLVGFRDLVPTAFDSHMQLFNTAGVFTASCAEGQFREEPWAGSAYLVLEFVVRVQRQLAVTYAA
jgi:hypothetical protein